MAAAVAAAVVTAALKAKDKKVIDAFYDKKPMEGSALRSDGKKLESLGMSGVFVKWQGGKAVVVSPGGNRTHDQVMRYMKKTWPKNSLPDHAQLRSAASAGDLLYEYEIAELDSGGRQIGQKDLPKPMNREQAMKKLLAHLRKVDKYTYGAYLKRGKRAE